MIAEETLTSRMTRGKRANDGNRTRMTSLEGWGSTIELHSRGGKPHQCRVSPESSSKDRLTAAVRSVGVLLMCLLVVPISGCGTTQQHGQVNGDVTATDYTVYDDGSWSTFDDMLGNYFVMVTVNNNTSAEIQDVHVHFDVHDGDDSDVIGYCNADGIDLAAAVHQSIEVPCHQGAVAYSSLGCYDPDSDWEKTVCAKLQDAISNDRVSIKLSTVYRAIPQCSDPIPCLPKIVNYYNS